MEKNLFTNQKEVDRAIQAAVDQYELCNNTASKHRRSRRSKVSTKNRPHMRRARNLLA